MNNKNLINKVYDDCYFSENDGYHESKHVFINGNDLNIDDNLILKIGETGFGTGLNLLVLEDFIEDSGKDNIELTFTSVEKFPLELTDLGTALQGLPGVKSESFLRHINIYKELFKSLSPGWNNLTLTRGWGVLKINLFYGDVMNSFKSYPVYNDCWFLDGHSPDKNPEMWNIPLFREVSEFSKAGATLATFTAAGVVKQGLRGVGFTIKRRKGYGKKRHMISGVLTAY